VYRNHLEILVMAVAVAGMRSSEPCREGLPLAEGETRAVELLRVHDAVCFAGRVVVEKRAVLKVLEDRIAWSTEKLKRVEAKLRAGGNPEYWGTRRENLLRDIEAARKAIEYIGGVHG
jgi:hypothetical protein